MSNENDLYRQRLLNVARALRESPKPEAFSMEWYGYGKNERFPCGTPQCALGHYAAREDLQDFISLNPETGNIRLRSNPELLSTSRQEAEHFGLSEEESWALFGPCGCGEPKSVEEAAAYIEDFVAHKYPLSALEQNHG